MMLSTVLFTESYVFLVLSTATDVVDGMTSLAVPVRESDVLLVMSAATDGVDAISPAVPVRDFPLPSNVVSPKI